jgi:tetratricopeptide (TPR) repeat protein
MTSTDIMQDCLAELKTRALEAQLGGRLQDAEALWGTLYRSTEEAHGIQYSELPKILLQAAEVAMQRRNYAVTCDYADRALRLLDEIADANNRPAERATRLHALNLYAAACRMSGRLQDAELSLQIALMEAEYSLGHQHPEVAAAWSELAAVYRAMNQPAEADRVSSRAIEASEGARLSKTTTWPVYCAFTPAA